jgi:hypothetical protein
MLFLQIIWRKSLHFIRRELWDMQPVGKLSAASRGLAMNRFRLLEPHLEADRDSLVIGQV